MKVLVTGASGFIGRAVAQNLLQKGVQVTVLIRQGNCQSSGSIPGAETVFADLCNELESDNVLKDLEFDVVLDAAAKIPLKNAATADYFDNVWMTRNLLRALNHSAVKYLVKLSTIDLYDVMSLNGKKISETTRIAPSNFYALSKSMSEQFCQMWAEKNQVPLLILRLTQVFGSGDNSSKFIPSALKSIKTNSKLYLQGDGSELRDYLYIEDLSEIIAAFLTIKPVGILNLASGDSLSIQGVISLLQGVCEEKFEVTCGDRTKPKIDYRFDIQNLLNLFESIQFTPLQKALKKTYDSL